MCLLGLAIHPSSDAAFFWTPYTTSCEAFVGGKEKETVAGKTAQSGGTLTWKDAKRWSFRTPKSITRPRVGF